MMKRFPIFVNRIPLYLSATIWSCGGSSGNTPGDATVRAEAPQVSVSQECRGKYQSPSAGQPCGCNADCDDSEVCLDEANTGMPLGSCVRPCSADRDCPASTACVGATGSATCLPACKVSSDCAAGRVCYRPEDGAPLVCTPLCQSDSDCPSQGYCDRYTGGCGSHGSPPGPGRVGAPCATGQDCLSETCLPHPGFPDGMCRATCSATKNGCPDGSDCIRIYDDEDYGWCLPSCNRHDDCRKGYSCQDLGHHLGPGSARLVCAPSEGTCLGQTATQAVRNPCGCDRDCGAGEFCFSESSTGRPGGYCLRYCDHSTDCGPGAECTGEGVCAALCATRRDCARGRICLPIGDEADNHCVEYCQHDTDCTELGFCDPYTGRCGNFGKHPGNKKVGQSCTGDGECMSDLCLSPPQFAQGSCSAICSLVQQGCPNGSSCSMPFTSDPGPDAGVCLATCSRDSDCRIGYSCAIDSSVPDYPACFPD
jgi:hypothetical protein